MKTMKPQPTFTGAGEIVKAAYLNPVQTAALTVYTRTRQLARTLAIGQPLTVNGAPWQITRRQSIAKTKTAAARKMGKWQAIVQIIRHLS